MWLIYKFPSLPIICVLTVLIVSLICLIRRLLKWDYTGVHSLYHAYLYLSLVAGLVFAGYPTVVSNEDWGWWTDYGQPNMFSGLLAWIAISSASTFFAEKRYALASIYSVLIGVIVFVLFLFCAEADFETVRALFPIMICTGVMLSLIALKSLFATPYN